MAGRRAATFAAVAALALVACGGGEGGTVEVTLQEFSIAADSSVGAGTVTFDVTNDGPNDPHELVVVKTDLGLTELPTNADGSFNEEGEGVEVIGEIEEFEPGTSQSMSWDLDAGSYVLLCNLVEEEEGQTEAHFALGMRTALTVE